MADRIAWLAEYIPSDFETYMRAHSMYFRGQALQPGVFKVRIDGMSVDWAKYSTPEETRQRGRKPLENAVIRLTVRDIRSISNLDVIHKPDNRAGFENRAHSNVTGMPEAPEDITEVRASLLEISRVVIRL